MNHGVGLFPESVSAAVSFAKYVDDSPYEKLWSTDSHQLYADPYVTLAQCAAATDRIELSTGVTNPITRHPTVTANAIASVNEISNGRTTLAIGAGDSAVYSIGKTPARVTELADTVTNIRALLDGEAVEFGGGTDPGPASGTRATGRQTRYGRARPVGRCSHPIALGRSQAVPGRPLRDRRSVQVLSRSAQGLEDRSVDAVYHGFPTRDVPGHARTFAERVLDE